VSSPDDPGYPGTSDPANGNGVPTGPRPGAARAAGAGPLSDPNDVPPWQRGPAARARSAERRAQDATPRTAGMEARMNRLAAGQGPTDTENPVPARSDAYQSELPDLSGPLPRPPGPRKQPAERPASEPPAAPQRPAAPAGRVQVATRSRSGPVRASMQIRRVDPWSVLKVSLVLSVSLFFVWMIAVAFLYLVLGGMGVWSKLNSNVGDLLTNTSNSELVSSGAIFGGAALIGLVNIVLLTAMATVAAFIYNLTTDLVGGVEVTLADRD
jgi:hypothetical protein